MFADNIHHQKPKKDIPDQIAIERFNDARDRDVRCVRKNEKSHTQFKCVIYSNLRIRIFKYYNKNLCEYKFICELPIGSFDDTGKFKRKKRVTTRYKGERMELFVFEITNKI